MPKLTDENKSRILTLLRKRESEIASLSEKKKKQMLETLLEKSPSFAKDIDKENEGRSDQTISN